MLVLFVHLVMDMFLAAITRPFNFCWRSSNQPDWTVPYLVYIGTTVVSHNSKSLKCPPTFLSLKSAPCSSANLCPLFTAKLSFYIPFVSGPDISNVLLLFSKFLLYCSYLYKTGYRHFRTEQIVTTEENKLE